MRFLRRRRAAFAALALAPLASCSYLADRALDFADQYRLAIGAGSVVGAHGRAYGLVDTGLMLGVKPRAAALGWRYGTPLYFFEGDLRVDADQSQVVLSTSQLGLDYAAGSYQSARQSFCLLPGVLSWVDSSPTEYDWQVPEEGNDYADRHWLWSGEGFGRNRYEQVHAFDAEFQVGLLLYLEAGYSVGELFDFLLGLVTIDLAKDDGRL